jgi:hypothetical protein
VSRRSAKWVRVTCEATALSVTTMSHYGSAEPMASMSWISFCVHLCRGSR